VPGSGEQTERLSPWERVWRNEVVPAVQALVQATNGDDYDTYLQARKRYEAAMTKFNETYTLWRPPSASRL